MTEEPGDASMKAFSSIAEIHNAAIRILDPHVLQLIDGGAGSGDAIRANEAAFDRWALRARALSGVENPDLGVSVLGVPLAAPLMFAPSGLHGLAHPEGEKATAAAARTAGLLMVISTHASFAVEEVAREGAPLWFQLYWGRDRDAVRALVERAEAAGCKAICLTVDMPTRPLLDQRMREAVAAIAHVEPAHGKPRSAHLDGLAAWDHDARLTWPDLAWLRSITALPIVIKGVMTGEDAHLAAEHGAAAVIVSNHGGRVLERGQATLETLPEIVDAAGDRIEIYLDGGIRRGSDIAVALALGARAVLIGRPVQWGLAVGGAAGAGRVAALLIDELRSLLTMMGAPSAAALSRASVRERR